jgi:hypothetical protein
MSIVRFRGMLAALGVTATAAVALPAHADTTPALRWFRLPLVTAYSGGSQSSSAKEVTVHMAPTLGDTEEADQIYAIRGLKMSEDSFDDACSVDFVAGFLDPARSKTVSTAVHSFSSKCTLTTKEAILPDGGFVTGLQVCTNGKSGADAKVKGLKLWGATIDANATFKSLASSVSFERTNCKTWEERVNCPSGHVATSVKLIHNGSIQKMALRCAKVYERSSTPPEQVTKVGEPTWPGTKMTIPISVENTGQNTLVFKGVTAEVVGKAACVQTIPNDTSTPILMNGTNKFEVLLACTPQQAAASCTNGTCTTDIKYRLKMTQPSAKTVEGTATVTFKDGSPQVRISK